MEEFELEISVSELKIGMYVARLDRPWLGSGFHFQGFQINGVEQIDQVASRCKHVYIDIDKSHKNVASLLRKIQRQQIARKLEEFGDSPNSPPLMPRQFSRWNPEAHMDDGPADELNPFTATVYEDTVAVEQELAPAKAVFEDFVSVMEETFRQVEHSSFVDQDVIRNSVHEVSNSIERNPDALIWLSRLGKHDDYTFRHCINMSIWSIALGRQIGLPPEDLKILGNGAVYCDLGKAKVPKHILESEDELTDEEKLEARRHVDYSLEILEGLDGVHPTIKTMVSQHHERHSGTGYPVRLYKHQIDLYARIVAIADTFDAMISERPHQPSVTVSDAVKELYAQRDRGFQSQLVEEFIHAIGLYPAGSLVELSTGEVAIVVGESRFRRLRPKVMLLTDPDKNHLEHHPLVDLMHNNLSESGEMVSIRKDLKPGTYGLNPSDYFI